MDVTYQVTPKQAYKLQKFLFAHGWKWGGTKDQQIRLYYGRAEPISLDFSKKEILWNLIGFKRRASPFPKNLAAEITEKCLSG